jgi:hypothetical protein
MTDGYLRFIPTDGQTTVPFFPVIIFSADSWCSYFDTTDGYLRFIPTDSQMTVPFFPVVFFSGRNLINKKTRQKKNNTHRHNNQQDEPCHPTLQQLCPLSLHGRAVAPPNHGATAPQRHEQAASYQGCDCCRWFACLGRQNKRHQIIERGGVLALGGRRFININNNQMEDSVDIRGCVGEEVRPGCNVWGGRLPVV